MPNRTDPTQATPHITSLYNKALENKITHKQTYFCFVGPNSVISNNSLLTDFLLVGTLTHNHKINTTIHTTTNKYL